MRPVLLSLATLLLSFAVLLAGNSLHFVALGQRAALEGFSALTMGLINTAYFAGFAVGSVYASRLIDGIGHVRAFAAAASMVSGIVLAHGVVAEPVAWAVMRLLTGLCFAVLYTVVESWVNARATNDVRGRLMSVYAATVFLAFAAGPWFANLGPEDGLFAFIVTSILVSVALVPVTVTRAGAPVPAAPGPGGRPADSYSLFRLYRETPLGAVGIVLVGMVQGAFMSGSPTFAETLGFPTWLLATFISLTLVSGMMAQYPLGWLSDRIDRRLSIVGIAGFGAAGALLLYAASPAGGGGGPDGLPAVVAGSLVVGATIFPLYAILVAYTNDWIPDNALVQAAASIQLTYGIGSMIGPSGAAVAMETLGAFGLFGFIGVIMAVLTGFAVYRMLVRDPVAAADQTDFVATAATPLMLSLDPRMEDDQLSFDFGADPSISPIADAETGTTKTGTTKTGATETGTANASGP